MLRVPYDVEAWGKLGSPFSSAPLCDDRRHKVGGSLTDSIKNPEPKEDFFSECLAEITGKDFKRKGVGDGGKKT
jgi:hypothetical protein